MNGDRQSAYLNLIDTLLNCPSGEEPEILNANSDLIDAGLVEMMTQVAAMLTERGDENAANFLQSVATKLAEIINNSSSTATQEAYFDFLREVLQATSDSKGDAKVVYPLLQANLEKLNLFLAQILETWATATIPDLEIEEAEYIAGVIFSFSNRIQQFPLGNRGHNLEIAIAGYGIALTVFTRERFPQDWATTQNNLGNAYLYRIRGEKAENLEVAIACYQEALKERTRESFPQNWATTQNNLGTAYSDRIRGEKAQNLEVAIACYREALKEYTRERFPQNWATTQNNLGTAYRNRIRGEKADNLEVAIACYREALKVRTRERFPQDWAMTQNNLGLAYTDRIRGEKAENLEEAIACYREALKERTRESFPQNHTETLFNLGLAYRETKQFQEAYNTFKAACDTVEFLRDEIISGE